MAMVRRFEEKGKKNVFDQRKREGASKRDPGWKKKERRRGKSSDGARGKKKNDVVCPHREREKGKENEN